MLDEQEAAEVDIVVNAANKIENLLDPEVVARIVSWRDTELGRYEEEDVKRLGHQVI